MIGDDIGTRSEVAGVLSEYFDGSAAGLLENETDHLLYAVLVELRAQRQREGVADLRAFRERQREEEQQGQPTERGEYRSINFDGDQREPLAEVDSADDYQEIELSFVSSQIDLRFNADLVVAFDLPDEQDDVVTYSADSSPVVGIPVETSKIWIGAQPGTGGGQATVEVWS